jgi:hypothetical protein
MFYKQQLSNDPYSSPEVESIDLLILQDKSTQCKLNPTNISDKELRKLDLCESQRSNKSQTFKSSHQKQAKIKKSMRLKIPSHLESQTKIFQ